MVLLKLSGFRLDEQRLADGGQGQVMRSRSLKEVLSLKTSLRLVRLSPAAITLGSEPRNAASRLRIELPTLSSNAILRRGQHHKGDGHRDRVSAHAASSLFLYAQRAGQVFALGYNLGQASGSVVGDDRFAA